MWLLESLDGWTCNVRIGKITCWSWDGRPKCSFSNKYLVIAKESVYSLTFLLKITDAIKSRIAYRCSNSDRVIIGKGRVRAVSGGC
jgi:hypothetical protein